MTELKNNYKLPAWIFKRYVENFVDSPDFDDSNYLEFLLTGFDWAKSKEGTAFWRYVYEKQYVYAGTMLVNQGIIP